jgi:nucleotide-binding universal stress UspA family protein
MNVLLPVDGSEHSELACQAMLGRPWPSGTRVRILHVLPKFPFDTPTEAEASLSAPADMDPKHHPASLMEASAQLTRQAELLTRRVGEQLRAAGLEVETRIVHGDARTEILADAENWEADLIVLASHGLTGLKRWLLGSVAHSIVSHAHCSVEIVRAKTPHEHGGKGSSPSH